MHDKYFFASDFHLGAPNKEISLQRERKIIRWLDYIKPHAKRLYLLGDIFDYWYEWNNVIPKGFYRFFNKLAELRDDGVEIIYFTGNHDVWQYHYLEDEFGIKVYSKPELCEIEGLKIYCGHGDGLGAKSFSYNIIKWVFTNKICQFIFSNFFHPNFAMWIGFTWSKHRDGYSRETFPFSDEDEHIIKYIRKIMPEVKADYYLFGHRHIEKKYDLGDNKTYINTGVWYKIAPYAEMSNGKIELKYFSENQ